MADFGQTDCGQAFVLTDFGQTDSGQSLCFKGLAEFGQNRFWPNRLLPSAPNPDLLKSVRARPVLCVVCCVLFVSCVA